VFAAFSSIVNAQFVVKQLNAVCDPAKRSEKALALADAAFYNAQRFYAKAKSRAETPNWKT
jgi:hypothetical protein